MNIEHCDYTVIFPIIPISYRDFADFYHNFLEALPITSMCIFDVIPNTVDNNYHFLFIN